jgi:lipid II:glycine glycyltransferase (peptidoglycan interpeptide bridge formation enzyme)
MEETAKRNGFRLHEKNYYWNIFRNLSKTNSYLSIAKYKQKVLAIDLVIIFGGIANYVFGGLSNEERNRMPAHVAQWKAICYAKQCNCAYYNFGGISTDNNLYKGWDGLTTFKKKFGGKEVGHSDFFDIVVNPLWYHLYNFRKLIKKIGV